MMNWVANQNLGHELPTEKAALLDCCWVFKVSILTQGSIS
jgi:hypothetical protein